MRVKPEAFLKRHAHLFVFFGALIVFLTFIVKEGLRDHWQHIAESIETAQYIYSIQTQTSTSKEQLEEIRESVSVIRFSPNKPVTGVGAYAMLMEQLGFLRKVLDDVDVRLNNIEILAGKLPPRDSTRQQLLHIHGDSQRVRFELGELEEKLSIHDPNAKTFAEDQKALEKLVPQYFSKEQELGKSVETLYSKTKIVVDELLAVAELTRDKNSTYAGWAWWISAFLFATGWGLGLVGKVYGVSNSAGSE